jgi:hypothetical protein
MKNITETKQNNEVMAEFIINEKTYVFDFTKMTAEQILICQNYWELSEQIKTILPTSNDELLKIMSKRINALGYEYLLMLKDKDGKLLKSTEEKNYAIGILSDMYGADFDKLEECKTAFFTKFNIMSQSSLKLIKELLPNGELIKLMQGQYQPSETTN